MKTRKSAVLISLALCASLIPARAVTKAAL
jgi:hypothetical protein